MAKKEKFKLSVFVSYARPDEATVRWLDKNLGTSAKLWTGMEIPIGSEWVGEIEQAISNAQLVLLLITPDFLESPFANLETGIALKHSRVRDDLPVIPVLMRGVTPDDLPPLLKNRVCIDGSRMTRDELLEELRRVISRTAAESLAESQAAEPEGSRLGKKLGH